MAEFRGGGGGWSGFGAYMRDKTIKLTDQFSGRYDKVSELLKGKTFWSTGRMAGIDVDIKELITRHGGDYLQYGFRNVTHILASNLAMSNQNWKKLLGGKFASKSYAIVTPQWLIDSIEAGRCLPESEYLPDCLKTSNDLRDILTKPVMSVGGSDYIEHDDYIGPGESSDSSSRITRLDIRDPRNTVEVVDNFCCDLIEGGVVVSRQPVSVTIVKNNLVNVEGLVFANSSISLSEALLDKLSPESWEGVTRVSLNLRPLSDESKEPRLDILPSISGIPPTELNNELNGLKSLILSSDEDSISANTIECLRKAGAATSLVILDIFDALLTARRLDLAREMVIALRNRVRNYHNDDLLDWYHNFVAKLQQLFQLRNHGATLHL